MSDVSSYVRRLVEAGCNPGIAAEVTADIFIAGVNAAPERDVTRNVAERYAERFGPILSDTPGAIRSRRWRENQKQNQATAEANDAAGADSQAVTGERYAQRHAATPPCNLSSLSSFSLEEATKEGSKKEGNTRARGTRLTSSATLSPADRQFAVENNIKNPDVAWAEFIDYWIAVPGSRGTKLNWSATWRNRVRQIGGGAKHEKTGNVIDAADRLIERVNAFDAPMPDHTSNSSGEGATVVRLLPQR